MNLKNILLLLLFGICSATAFAQSEPFTVTFDKPFYLTGETVNFTAWFTANTAPQSKIVRFDLLDAAGKIITRQKVSREEKSAAGSYFIPAESAAGHYLFRFYTLRNLSGKTNAYVDYRVPIYSSLLAPEVTGDDFSENRNTETKPESGIFKNVKKVYPRGEEVNLLLDFKINEVTEYAVTVTDLNWFPAARTTDISPGEKSGDYTDGATFPTETEPTFALQLTNPEDGTPFNSDFILISQPAAGEFLQIAVKDGKTDFSLPDFAGRKEIQVHNLNPYLPFLPQVEKAEIYPDLPTYTLPPLPPADSTVLAYFEKIQKLRKMREMYPLPLPVAAVDTATLQKQKVAPVKTYRTADYIGMTDLTDFIESVILSAAVSEKDGVKTVRLGNDDNRRRYLNAPVYFVNGYLSGNEAEILQIPLSQIETVEIYNSRETITAAFPKFMLGMGVISVTTRKNTVPQSISRTFNSLTLRGISAPVESAVIKAEMTEKMPIYRPIIYRKSGLKSAADGRATLSFYPSSAIGEYEIRVEYLDKTGTLHTVTGITGITR